ncbi:MAG: ribosome maturation factor, partial [Novosphingobium sp.]
MADIARIIDVVEPEAKALGFDLVRVRYFKGGEIGPLSDAEEYTLQIMAERPETGQLVIEDCAALSHRVSDAIDALEEKGEVLIADAYRLEV